jgi:hypothetical protein
MAGKERHAGWLAEPTHSNPANEWGTRLYPQQPGVGDMQRELDQHGYEREKGADQRAWDVLGDPKQ